MYKVMNVEDVDTCKDEQKIYLSFRPSNAHVMTLLKNNPELESLQVAENFKRNFSRMARDLCQMHGVRVRFKNVRKYEWAI